VLRIEASERGLSNIRYLSKDSSVNPPYSDPQDEFARNCVTLCVSALNSYFAKQWGAFEQLRSKISLDLKGTEFQKKVWGIIYSMPNTYPIVGMHYSELAYLSGKPKAVRACANICGQNQIPILIPCHRILQANGKLGGYSGGIDKKSWLLWHENVTQKDLKFGSLLQQPPQTR